MQGASKYPATSRPHGVVDALFAFFQPLARHVTWDDLAEDDFVIVPSRHDLQACFTSVLFPSVRSMWCGSTYDTPAAHSASESSRVRVRCLHRLPPGPHHDL